MSSTLNHNQNNGSNFISSKNDLEYFNSLEDLNKEIEKLSLLNNSESTTSRFYSNIFSRQSIESDANSSPEIDDEPLAVNFLSCCIPENHGCKIIQPKKGTIASTIIPNQEIYQPCTNIQKILKSSCSAFREMSEIKIVKSQTDDDNDGDNVNYQEAETKSDAAVAVEDIKENFIPSSQV